jgi:hypothetical protein
MDEERARKSWELFVSLANWLRYLHLIWFSRPRGCRQVYRRVNRTRARSFLQIGIPDLRQSGRIIRLASASGEPGVRYSAIDPFETRDVGNPLTLKQAHIALRKTPAQVKLLPGMPGEVLARSANALGTIDLILISADWSVESIGRGWLYVPRLLHDRSVVLLESRNGKGDVTYRELPRAEIEALARRHTLRRAA